ncbi:hypothetical protein CY35_12G000200 [Sphagnum magellanicum]|nr:hypothetical protein CY35_12G000200 [Sphagnum magellanicum]
MSSRREYIIGSTFEGIVKCVKSYGAFIDIGDDVGLLHISEISHVRVTSMEALFAPGEKIKVMILNQDKTKGHLKLSTKQLETKPGDMLHVQAYQKGTMEGNLIENEDNAMNKGLPNLLIPRRTRTHPTEKNLLSFESQKKRLKVNVDNESVQNMASNCANNYYCTYCEKCVSSNKKCIEDHNNSKPHQRFVKLQENTHLLKRFCIEWGENGHYMVCKACETSVPTCFESIMMHVTGLKHVQKQRIQQLESLFQNTCK